MDFDWDEGNLSKSRVKHNVTVEESESVFFNKESITLPDEKHSLTEKRFVIVGKSENNRYLLISFTLRKDKIRIISARRMHREEVEKYEEIKKNLKK